MKKRAFALALCAVLVCSLFSLTATAASSADIPDLTDPDSYTVYHAGRADATWQQEGDTFVSNNTVGVCNKAIVKNVTVSDFTARFTIKLDETGRGFAGLLFRMQSVGNHQDDMEGYELLFDRVIANDNGPRFDLSLHKFGPATAGGGNIYIGQVGSDVRSTTGRATDEAESAILKSYGNAAGKELIVEVTVIGKHIWAFARLKDDPEVVSAALNCELDAPITGDKLGTYYESGSIGVIAATDASHDIVNTLSDFEIVTDTQQVREGLFNQFDDFYFFTEDTVGGFYSQEDGSFAGLGSGIKKALVRGCYEDGDITASVKLSRDADGNLEGGLMFHATDVLQWNDKMQGYSVYVNSFADAPDKVEVFLYKYGPDLTGTCAYLGIISPTNTDIDVSTETYIEEGEGSVADGVDSWILKVKTVGTQVQAQLVSEDGEKYTPILTYDTTGEAQGGSTDIKKAVFSTGGLGVTMRRGKFTDFRIGEAQVGEFVTGSNLVLIVVILAVGVVVVAAAVTVIVVVLKKNKA